MKETTAKHPFGLVLEVEDIEKRGKPGGCQTSSSTSPLCTCPCREFGVENQ